ARALQRRQRVEDGRPALGVFAGGDLALGLVVHQHARRFGQGAGDELAAVDLHLVAAADADANLRDLAVDLDQAVGDALFQCTPRTEAGLGEHLVQALFEPGGGGGSAALEGQFVAGLLVHRSCSDEAVAASSSCASLPGAAPSSAGSGSFGDVCSPLKASCGSSSPMSRSSDSGGSSSRLLSPK